MVHSGSTPAFIAPDSGPASTYLTRIDKLRDQINEIGLSVATINQQESGIAMQTRFASINAELAAFSRRMEDLERCAWELSRRWLGMTTAPEVAWPRDFNLADVESELRILADMQAAAMPTEVIAEQQKRIIAIQFGGLSQDRKDEISTAIDERTLEVKRKGIESWQAFTSPNSWTEPARCKAAQMPPQAEQKRDHFRHPAASAVVASRSCGCIPTRLVMSRSAPALRPLCQTCGCLRIRRNTSASPGHKIAVIAAA